MLDCLSVEATNGRALQSQIDGNDDASMPTLGDWLSRWLRICTRRGVRAVSVESYRNNTTLYVSERLRHMPLDRIRAADLNDHYDRLLADGRRDGAGGLSARTVRYTHTLLKRAFADAVRQGLIDVNPAERADPPSQKAARAPVFPVWSASELQRFLASARDDSLYAAFHLAASTGLRRSELLGLRWRDVDLERAELHVLQSVVVVGRDVRIGPPKTDRSRRLVALDAHTVEVLREHQARWMQRDGSSSSVDDAALLFCNEAGSPIHPSLFTYYFGRRVEFAGVRKIRPS